MPKIKQIAEGVRDGNIRSLAKAITLIESRNPDHSRAATTLLDELLPDSGQAIRVGISGVPGVGKSTLIEALGMMLIDQGHR
ncbi:MAG: methylmalonyl Co-A mutase-associated GTPase MeaB, partial [Geopsychrobacter sp.]|nr:methylmalonyl Co-A mutase-associated GTPase MeaB [Geopsychrobacter sp.]